MNLLSSEDFSCNDKWLSGLVNAMEEVSLMRADDICRSAVAPQALTKQLGQRRMPVKHTVRIAA